ncbi:MAG: hypothetical protein HC880_17195 [Bacteroidia bacterium]|nr:hypothetical protein [Bacteroidia bacterium]
MLPVYEAYEFIEVLKGGRTKPWLVLVRVQGIPIPFVVKLFTEEEIERDQKVTKEVLGSVLAREFDLPTPEAALIRISSSLIEQIRDQEPYFQLAQRDHKIMFGCAYLEKEYLSTASFSIESLDKYDGIDSIFAFDCLIKNFDRGIYKPNVILHENEFYLIDHESSLKIGIRDIQNFKSGQVNKIFQNHLFLGYLSAKSQDQLFDLFVEYLRMLNLAELDSYLSQLQQHKHPVGNIALPKQYLSMVKQDIPRFIRILYKLVSHA